MNRGWIQWLLLTLLAISLSQQPSLALPVGDVEEIPTCPANQHFEACGAVCDRDCTQVNNDNVVCPTICLVGGGCSCNPGFYRLQSNNQECVSATQCQELQQNASQCATIMANTCKPQYDAAEQTAKKISDNLNGTVTITFQEMANPEINALAGSFCQQITEGSKCLSQVVNTNCPELQDQLWDLITFKGTLLHAFGDPRAVMATENKDCQTMVNFIYPPVYEVQPESVLIANQLNNDENSTQQAIIEIRNSTAHELTFLNYADEECAYELGNMNNRSNSFNYVLQSQAPDVVINETIPTNLTVNNAAKDAAGLFCQSMNDVIQCFHSVANNTQHLLGNNTNQIIDDYLAQGINQAFGAVSVLVPLNSACQVMYDALTDSTVVSKPLNQTQTLDDTASEFGSEFVNPSSPVATNANATAVEPFVNPVATNANATES